MGILSNTFYLNKHSNMPINKQLYGKWELVEADSANFDAYMKKCGVGMALRLGAKMMKQTLGIIDDAEEGKVHLTTESTMANSDQVFELGGVEQDEKTWTGENAGLHFKSLTMATFTRFKNLTVKKRRWTGLAQATIRLIWC